MGVCLIVVLALLVIASARRAAANEHLTADQMRVALRTASIEEDGFIDRVLAAVDKGVLPESLVQSTFLWARKKTKYRFRYFKYGLILRAADQGVTIQ
jgi:hypothetical protein